LAAGGGGDGSAGERPGVIFAINIADETKFSLRRTIARQQDRFIFVSRRHLPFFNTNPSSPDTLDGPKPHDS
jgi:hypothetical protein